MQDDATDDPSLSQPSTHFLRPTGMEGMGELMQQMMGGEGMEMLQQMMGSSGVDMEDMMTKMMSGEMDIGQMMAQGIDMWSEALDTPGRVGVSVRVRGGGCVGQVTAAQGIDTWSLATHIHTHSHTHRHAGYAE